MNILKRIWFNIDLLFCVLLGAREVEVFHPESPGLKVVVRRNKIGRLFKPKSFATIPETLRYYGDEDSQDA
ncbi:MAG: hypothetical protein KAS32_22875 [Candidatus Peribacteraceae bacterium]|nr:hypothetical protein [Candidatus Peribacteraceae bacterium]